MNKLFPTLCFIIFQYCSLAQSSTCAGMTQICLTPNTTYQTNANNGPLAPGNNYDCLVPSNNISWFFFQISASGNISLALTSPVGTDLDFAI
ncbi:MAG: hypothetical protein AB8B74_04265 [Crocinitomicaceae bacterium]